MLQTAGSEYLCKHTRNMGYLCACRVPHDDPQKVVGDEIMAPASATVEILVTRGRLEPQVAVAVGEAIESEMTISQMVTVPILDARLAVLKAELEAKIDVALERTKAEMVRWVFTTCIGSCVINAASAIVIHFLGRAH